MLKSNKGYSLIEIGVGILILTIFLIVSIGLFNGCYSNYRRIKQRNIAISRAVYYIENMLQTDSDVLTGFFVQKLDKTIDTYTLQPSGTFLLFVKNHFDDFKARYAKVSGVSVGSVTTPSDKSLAEYIFADSEYLINEYIKYDVKHNASETQLQNGSYGFINDDGRFSGNEYTIIIENDIPSDITVPEDGTFINSNGGAFRIKKTISRIPVANNTAFGNNVLCLKVEVFYTYDFSRVLSDDNLEVMTLSAVKY